MFNFWSLVGFEYKKLMRRRSVWISLGLMLVVGVFSGCCVLFGTQYVDGRPFESHADGLYKNISYARKLSGRPLDDELLQEMRDGFAKVPEEELAQATEEYQTYARPYEAIWAIAYQVAGQAEWDKADQERFYELRREKQESEWKELGLSQGELSYLRQKEEQISTPFVYEYCGGYQNSISLLYTVGIMATLLAAICVPGIFAEEHSRKTDQVILASRLGRKTLFWAKTATGLGFMLFSTLLLCLSVCIPAFAIYGLDGANGAIQLLCPSYPYPLTVGEALLIVTGLCFAAAFLHGAFGLLLAELLGGSVQAMAVMVGFLMVTLLFNVSDQYRLLSQIWDCMPSNLTSFWGAFQMRLFPVGNTYLAAWQAVPALYLLISGLALYGCWRLYRNYQVG